MRVCCRAVVLLLVLAFPFSAPAGAGREAPGEPVARAFGANGAALVSSPGSRRFSALRSGAPLRAGDRLRTAPTGAGVVTIELRDGGRARLGPGSTAVLAGPGRFRLLAGEAEVAAPLTLEVPGGGFEVASGTRWLRAGGAGLTLLPAAPDWLAGSPDAPSGGPPGRFLVTTPEGDTALPPSRHDVSVVIRDRIAETTTVLEFRNPDDRPLAGTFTPWTPPGAIFSGFGEGPSGEIVLAEVVARPAGGEGPEPPFAAPIALPAGGERSLLVRYVEILPREGDRLRYRYPLGRRTSPRERVGLEVEVGSPPPVVVESPTHPLSIETGGDAVRVRAAMEGTAPDRDFELLLTPAGAPPLTVLRCPTAEGTYFAAFLDPPAPPDGPDRAPEPLLFVLLADTSFSMDPGERRVQTEFLGTLLALLEPTDRFHLAAVDESVAWFSGEPSATTSERIEAAMAWLSARPSAGATDIARGFAEASARAGAGSAVVYAGDGIATLTDDDPPALAKRLERLMAATPARFFAAATGAESDRTALAEIARIGGGLALDAAGDPLGTAAALLAAVAGEPPAWSLRVAGAASLETAGPPEGTTFPGGGQVVIGRFRPTKGEAPAVTAISGDGAVRHIAPLGGPEDEDGNFFLPLLFAHRRAGALLSGLPSEEACAEAIALGIGHGFLTPLTWFLSVPGDGERRTAEVSAAAVEEARERWRELRRQAVLSIAALGRSTSRYPPFPSPIPVPRASRRGSAPAMPEWLPVPDSGRGPAPAATVPTAPVVPSAPRRRPPPGPTARAPAPVFTIEMPIPQDPDDPAVRRAFPRPDPRYFPSINRTMRLPPETPAGWPPEVARLVEGYAPPTRIAAVTGGLQVHLRVARLDPKTGREESVSGRTALLTADGWFFRPEGTGTDGCTQWLMDGRRGAADGVLGLAREIPATEADEWLGGVVFIVLARDPREWNQGFSADAPVRENGRIVLAFRTAAGEVERHEIDEVRGDLLAVSRRAADGSLLYATSFSDFRDAAGLRIAGQVEFTDPRAGTTTRTTAEVVTRPAEDVAAEIRERIAAGPWVVLRDDLPEPAVAREAEAAGRAGFPEYLLLALFESERGEPDRALAALARAREFAPAVPGLDLTEAELLVRAGRGAETEPLLMRVAAALAREADPGFRLEYLLSIAAQGLPPDAALALLRRLRETLGPTIADNGRRRLSLEYARVLSLARREEGLAFLRSLLAVHPGDVALLRDAAYVLRSLGEHDEAIAFARAAAEAAGERAPELVSQTRQLLFDCLFGAGKWPEILAESGCWLESEPRSATALGWHLRALVRLDRAAEGEALALREIDAGWPGKPGDDPFEVAVQFAFGESGEGRWGQEIGATSREALVRAAVRLASSEHPRGGEAAARILDHYKLRQTPETGAARAGLKAALLAPGAAEEAPLRRLANLTALVSLAPGEVPEEEAARFAAALRTRRETADEAARDEIDDLLIRFCDARGDVLGTAALLRARLAGARLRGLPPNPVLLGRLLGLPWSGENEEAVLDALPALVGDPGAYMRAHTAAGAARQVAESLLEARLAAGGPAADVRRSLAARLRAAAAGADECLRPWLELEALELSVEAGEDPADLERRLVEQIRNPPALSDPRLAEFFADQAFSGLDALALCAGSDPDLAERVLALHREAVARADSPRAGYRLGRLLVALDRREDLLALLRARPSPISRFEAVEALLLAADGRIGDAATVLEAALGNRRPSAEAYGTLAGLYGLLGRSNERIEMLDRRYATLDFNRLAEELRARLQPEGGARPLPADPGTFRMLEALIARGTAEELARGVWLATRDSRALTALLAGVPRTSAEGTCAELSVIRRVLLAVEDPGALETLAAAASDRATRAADGPGRRALRFVVALAVLRGAELTGDSGPVEKVAVPALRDAFPPPFPPADRRAYAGLIAYLPRPAAPAGRGRPATTAPAFPAAFAKEILGQLRELAGGIDPRTAEGAEVATALAVALWAEGRGDEAITLLAGTLEGRRPSPDGPLPADCLPAVDLLAGWCEAAGNHRVAEDLYAGEARRQTAAPLKARYVLKLLGLYPRALAAGATLSAGEGASLYHSSLGAAVDALPTLPVESFPEAVRAIDDLALAAHRRDIPGVASGLASYARERIFEALDRARGGAPDLRIALARTIAEAGDPAAAFLLLLDGMEAEVAADRLPGGDGWPVLARGIGDLRRKELSGELLDRFHAVALARLAGELDGRGDLLLRSGREWYWTGREADVAAAVLAIAAERSGDPAVSMRAAAFLRDALRKPKEAVALLLDREARGGLTAEARETVAKWLVDDRAYAEAVPLLGKCVAEKPDDMPLRRRLLLALAAAGLPEEAARCAAETESVFRAGGDIPPRAAADLGLACLAGGLPSDAARLLDEAIRASAAANAGSVPPGWREGLAKALAALGRPEEAIRAMVDGDVNQHAIREVIAAAGDPGPIAKEWRRIVDETGRDDPRVRLALGSLFGERRDWPAAVRELRIAWALRPGDRETRSLLLQSLDATDDQEAAIELLAAALREEPMNPDTAVELGRRLGRLRRPGEAARVISTGVEVAPRNPRAREDYAAALTGARRLEDALAQREVLLRLSPNDPHAWYRLVLAHIDLERFDQARRLLDEMAAQPWDRAAGDAKRLIESAEKRLAR